MSRTIYDASGTDVSSTVIPQIISSPTLVIFRLFRLQTMIFWGAAGHANSAGSFGDFAFTDAPFPVLINKYQIFATGASQLGIYTGVAVGSQGVKFMPENMSCTQLSYEVGLTDHPCTIDWRINDSFDYGVVTGAGFSSLNAGIQSPVNTTIRKALLMGAFLRSPFWVHDVIYSDFPNKGGVMLGTTLMFRGYLRGVDVIRSGVKLTLSSLLDVFQQTQIPTQTLTPSNRALPYFPAAPSPISLTSGAPVVVTPTLVKLPCTNPVAQDFFKDAWVSFQPAVSSTGFQYYSGYPMSPAWRIQSNLSTSSTADGYVWCYFYEPPIVPVAPANPINIWSQSTSIGGNVGFPYIPPPEFNI